jgi:hypothetical protein
MIWTYVLIGLAAFVLLLIFSFLRATAKVPTYQTAELLAGLKSDVQAIIDTTKNDFEPLSVAELSERPAPNSWSVGECLQHLNLYGDYYLPAIKAALEAEGQPQPTFKGSALGEYFANLMRPREDDGQPKSKMPTFKDKNPTLLKIEVTETTVADFLAQQALFLEYLKAAESKNIARPKIKITISRLIRLSLGDTFRFNIYHSMRHVQQALRALSATTKK